MFAQRRRYDVLQMHRRHADRKAGDRGVQDARAVCVFTRACRICEMIARLQTNGTRGMGMQAESPSQSPITLRYLNTGARLIVTLQSVAALSNGVAV
jgi:hypothetical protein